VQEVPSVPRITRARSDVAPGAAGPLRDRVVSAFSPKGVLARAMPEFEAREGQVEMALAAADAFEDGGVLLVEAGTGTGKTLAYLVPAILSRQRVLISTGTKNLQEQIFFKDIPALRDALGIPFTATYMKGRANYLCLHRLHQFDQVDQIHHQVFLPIIREWSARTETGDRSELEDLPEELPFWNEISATADTCLGDECTYYDECFITRMRQRAAASDIVIVNHHLLCADAAVRQNAYGEVIPAYSHAVLDEAHQLEDVATQYFGYSVSNYRVEELARDVERLVAAGLIDDEATTDGIAKAVARMRDHAGRFFTEVAQSHGPATPGRNERNNRNRATAESLDASREAAAYLTGALDVMEATLALLPAGPRYDRGTERDEDGAAKSAEAGTLDDQIAALLRRTRELRDELRFLLRAGDPDFVYFVELRGRGTFLRGAPIDVSKIVREVLFDRMRTTILTSATMTVDGNFQYIRDRLGIGIAAAELRLPPEFDYARQAVLYLPPRMPEPRAPGFAVAAGREVVEILRRTRGRAFVLFTSYATLSEVQAVAELALDYPIFAQGTAPRSRLLKQFRETPHAVLFATSSFWQGVDVIGEALSCVIIDKLPFASPADPITAARIDAIRMRGGAPFDEYQVPLAILALQQGLGRLIRHRRDRGVLAILDPRLRTKGYGQRFVTSLPAAPIVRDLREIERFFQI
jgi:ATP-dependent DNA helicase DinG